MAGILNIEGLNNADLIRVFQWLDPQNNPRDLTNFTAQMMIRTSLTGPILIECSSLNGRLIIPPSNINDPELYGTIRLHITAQTMQTLFPGTYVYDLVVTAPNDVKYTIATGTVKILASITGNRSYLSSRVVGPDGNPL